MSDNEQAVKIEEVDNRVYTLVFIPTDNYLDLEAFNSKGTKAKLRKVMRQQAQYLIEKMHECVLEIENDDSILIFKKQCKDGYIWSSIRRDLWARFKIVPLVDAHREDFEPSTPINSPRADRRSTVIKGTQAPMGLGAAVQKKEEKKESAAVEKKD